VANLPSAVGSWQICRELTPLPSAREVALGKDPFAVRGFAECSCRVYGKAFAECKQAFAKCNWHSAKK